MFVVLLKSGRLEFRRKQPTNRAYLERIRQEDPSDSQHVTFQLKAHVASGQMIEERTVETWCGHDRGPVLEIHMRAMLTVASASKVVM